MCIRNKSFFNMVSKQQRKLNQNYFRNYLFSFLGFEKDVYVNDCGSYTFYNKGEKLILWIGTNKIQIAKNNNWISNADKYIIKNIIKEKNIYDINEYNKNNI